MSRFLEWFNSRAEPEALLRAAIAHLWFVTIHPFDDGNGRIARAITEMVLAQSEDSPQRFYTMAGQINAERKIYYAALERTQKGNLDLTPWTTWFLDCLGRAIDASDSIQKNVLRKADFWSAHAEHHFTERQKKILSRWLEGIEGNMTARKWAAFGKCSMPTAQRDVADLIERDIIRKNPGGGKNTSYAIVD